MKVITSANHFILNQSG